MNRTAFVAIISPATGSDLIQRIAGTLRRQNGLATLADDAGLLILGDPNAAHLLLSRQRGLIWGHVFDRTTSARVTPEVSGKLDRIDTQTLLNRFWGGYVAIRRCGSAVEILRDPSGAVACYFAEIDGSHFVTSRPDLLFELGLLRPHIDWAVIAQGLIYSDVRPARTALRGVSEILPGLELRVDGGRADWRCAWSPWSHAAITDVTSAGEAVARLRRVATDALGAWGRCFDRPVVEISGGLDSAIVAAGMCTSDMRPRCVTFGPKAGDPDERPWARAIAERLGTDLHELELAVDAVDLRHSDAAHLPRPCMRFYAQALDRPIQAFARDAGADAFLGGGGGDSVFFHLHSALAVVDRVRQEGLGSGAFRTAMDVAQIAQTDTWSVLGAALRRWLRRPSAYPTPMSNCFAAAKVRDDLPWPAGNPWLEAPGAVAPGRRRHVWALMTIQNHLEGHGREAIAPFISPLMSQPILETSLGFPSWLWSDGGQNRAVAREAFRPLLPRSVVERRTKGSFNQLVTTLLEANRGVIREMLHDGALAREGMLDMAAVDACLDGNFPEHDALSQFMMLVDYEAWLARWESY